MNTKKADFAKLTVGLDFGDRHHHVCVLDEMGEVLAREVLVNTREVLTTFLARYAGATVVMDRALTARGFRAWPQHQVIG